MSGVRLRMSTPGEVRKSLTKISNMVINGDLPPAQANAIIAASNVVLNAIRTDEQERKLAELEQIVNETKQGR